MPTGERPMADFGEAVGSGVGVGTSAVWPAMSGTATRTRNPARATMPTVSSTAVARNAHFAITDRPPRSPQPSPVSWPQPSPVSWPQPSPTPALQSSPVPWPPPAS